MVWIQLMVSPLLCALAKRYNPFQCTIIDLRLFSINYLIIYHNSSRKRAAMAKITDKIHLIKDAKQLKALRAPVRQKIVLAMGRLGACTVSALSPHVGLAPESLYYHVNNLVKAGLLKEKDRRLSGKRMECIYELVTPRIEIDRTNRTPSFLNALADLYRSALRAAERDLLRALQFEKTVKSGPRTAAEVRQLTVRLNEKSAAEVRQKLNDLYDVLLKNDEPEGEKAYTLTTAFNLFVKQEKE
jgi:DNA-binding transcriptional ArsR family regulator